MLLFAAEPPAVVAQSPAPKAPDVICWGSEAVGYECEPQQRRQFPTPLQLPSPVLVDSVIVTAARLAPLPTDAAFSVTTVDSGAIGASPRVDEALTLVPGVQLFRRTSSAASNPTTQGITVRAIAGSGAGRALVTLDGVPQNDPFGGWVLWSGLPTADIEGALVVRGAGAGPYGSGALTGTVQLSERTRLPERGEYEIFGGERGLLGGQFAWGAGSVMVVGAAQRTDGWIPVRQGRGAADQPLAFEASSLAIRWSPEWDGGDLSLRLAGYNEERGSGLAGATSRSTGLSASATMTGQSPGIGNEWRLQAWARMSDLENSSAAVAAGRVSTTPASEQFGTPALGLGFNAALRHTTGEGGWEVGGDVRWYDGETREHYRYMAGAFTRGRVAGGTQYVAGLYGEAWRETGPWLVTGGVRLDRWASFDGERVERDLTSGATTLDHQPADADGWQPTARAAARYAVGDGFVRVAGYAGFRPPTLNELHRPFRVGNDVTEANAGLEPEVLYGAEFGGGYDGMVLDWSATLFTNRLEGAVTNVTIGFGPGTFPVAGFIPAGGVLRQRQNAGDIDAWGVEADLTWEPAYGVSFRLAGAWTTAEVDGGSHAPQLTGLRPAQTPEVSLSAEAAWKATRTLWLRATVRHEGDRWDDDLNTRRLAAATSLDLRADWWPDEALGFYIAGENVTDAAVETAQTGDGIESYDQPRTVRVGIVWRP
jgi:outer membrane receptor protein involved in Fe transport